MYIHKKTWTPFTHSTPRIYPRGRAPSLISLTARPLPPRKQRPEASRILISKSRFPSSTPKARSFTRLLSRKTTSSIPSLTQSTAATARLVAGMTLMLMAQRRMRCAVHLLPQTSYLSPMGLPKQIIRRSISRSVPIPPKKKKKVWDVC